MAGVDEVGRGCLAGPVFAAAVILNKNIDTKNIKDSKKLSFNRRILLSHYIKKKLYICLRNCYGRGNKQNQYFKCFTSIYEKGII